MKKLSMGIFGLALLTSASALSFPTEQPARGQKIAFHVLPAGDAIFFVKQDQVRHATWTVTCRVPLRGCVARSYGLVLSITDTKKPILTGYAPNGAKVALLEFGTIREMDGVLTRPLTAEELSIMGQPGAILVIEADGEVFLRASLGGIEQVANYLRWLKEAARKGERSARNWPGIEAIDTETALLETSVPQAPSKLPHTLPRTKPQVEFAIRAQSGQSLFDATGH